MKVDTTQRIPIKMWTNRVEVEDEAYAQLRNVASLPFVFKHLAVMPDVHWGKGATVGSVIPTKGAIIPAAVGVDIGCGMVAVRTSLTSHDLPDSLKALRHQIEKMIPVGFADYGDTPPKLSENVWKDIHLELDQILAKYPKAKTKRSPLAQIGTLGGGNHFIELCLDDSDQLWVMLHSGSRGQGNRIGQVFINAAKEEMERHFIHLPDKDLAYLVEGSALFDDYIQAVHWAQEYARLNREVMVNRVLLAMHTEWKEFECDKTAINCHHNYVARENHFGSNVWLTRKGAVRAREGDLGIIPGSMGARSYIVRGLGNDQSFHSCSHGAGRRMSRSEAKRTFTIDDHRTAVRGVECRTDEGVLDETPMAYKDIDAVMSAQSELVEPLHVLKQILCVKG